MRRGATGSAGPPGAGAVRVRRGLDLAARCLVPALVAVVAWGPPAVAMPDSVPAPGAEAAGERRAAGHRRMVEALARVAEETRRANPFLSGADLEAARRRVAELPLRAPLPERVDAHLALGLEEFRVGSLEAAIGELGEVERLVGEAGAAVPADFRLRLHYYLGLAWLRAGERQNCVARHAPESCILPIRGGGVHQAKEGARRAVEHLRRVLEGSRGRPAEQLAARWLMSVAAMAAGDWPDGLSESERIPPGLFRPEADFPRLPNRAPHLGLATFDLAGGVVADDLTGDGLPDLLTSTWDPSGPMHLFVQVEPGRFVERPAVETGLEGITGGLNLVQADFDDDGDLDVLVLRGGWLGDSGRHPNSLLENDGSGRFTDVTFAAGLGEVHHPTQTAAWADYDRDGDLDLYVGNESPPGGGTPSQLFANQGDGTFVDVAAAAGVENRRFAKGVAWGDFDGDDDPDLYVSNYTQENRLYRNRGDGTFADVAVELGVERPLESFPTWFWDYDQDGALDLFVSSYPNGAGPSRLAMVVSSYLGLPAEVERARLYRGDGRGGFREVGAAAGLGRISMPMGANFGDLDGDGWPDLYLGTGYPSYDGLMPNVLYRNRRGQGFVDVTFAAGVGHLQKGHGVAFFDADGDGDLDLFEQMGGFYPDDAYPNALFENPGFGHHWLEVELVGVDSDRFAVGASLALEVVEGGERRTIHQRVTSGGSFGASPLVPHVGLGGAERVERLAVRWPTTGRSQVVVDVAADQRIRVVEGREGYEVVEPGTTSTGEPSGAGTMSPR